MTKKLLILGTRGIPAAHGGFETFAEHLACYLQKRGWEVSVYCQHSGAAGISYDEWQGVKRINIALNQTGSLGSIIFDWRSIVHAAKQSGTILVLGYNTAVFLLWFKLKRRQFVINMDGIEWKRAKWSAPIKLWFWLNERIGAGLSTVMIADHPLIQKHLERFSSARKICMIPYGANAVSADDVNTKILAQYELGARPYAIVVARPEPENSLVMIVEAFCQLKGDIALVLLGEFSDTNAYHAKIKRIADDRVHFLGAIYEPHKTRALRSLASFYVHGHTVGGTNPSLIEALAAGSPVLAHDNGYNRWVAQDAALYFSHVQSCTAAMEQLFFDKSSRQSLATAAVKQHASRFTWEAILLKYQKLLER